MTRKQKEALCRRYARECLKYAVKEMQDNIDKAIKSGAVSITDWGPNFAPYIMPKTIVCAVLEHQAASHINTVPKAYKRMVKKSIRNIRYFL